MSSRTPALQAPRLPDPTSLSVREPLPTQFPSRDVIAAGITPPAWQDTAGHRLPLDQVAANVAASPDPVAAVAALISRTDATDQGEPIIRYVPYGNLANARPTVADAWSRGHGECDAIMSIGAYLLTKSGAVPKDDVVVAQSFALGGWHNVIIFRDPHSGKWTVMDYQNVVTLPNARSREAALREYFHLNSGVSVLYRVDNPNARPVALYQVKSDHVALVDGATMHPGLGRAMDGNYGTIRGENDDATGALPHPGDGAHGSVRGGVDGADASFETDGTRVDAAMRRAPGSSQIDRAGISVLHATDGSSAVGGKVLFHRNPGSTSGSSLLVAGEWWRVRGGNFLGIVSGVDTRVDVLTGHTGQPVTTVAPFIAASGGMTHTLVDSHTVHLDAFWNAYGRVNVPLVIGAKSRGAVMLASNGQSPGGMIDPGGLASGSTLGANAGLKMRLRLGPTLHLNSELTAHSTLTDPTLAPLSMYLPMRGAVDGRLSLDYQGERAAAQVGVLGTVGSIYDRDVRAGVWAAGRVRLSKQVDVDLGVSGGHYVSGSLYGDARGGVTYRPGNGPFDVRLSGGATVLADPGAAPYVLPHADLSVGARW